LQGYYFYLALNRPECQRELLLKGLNATNIVELQMLDGFIKDHMINLTYGGVAPVPDVVKFAIIPFPEIKIINLTCDHLHL